MPSLFNTNPPLDDTYKGYTFHKFMAQKLGINPFSDSTERVYSLGSYVNPMKRSDMDTTSLNEDTICEPVTLSNYSSGQIIAIQNEFITDKYEGEYILYILTNPYQVHDTNKDSDNKLVRFKLLPLDESLDDARIYGDEVEENATLITSDRKIDPVTIYPVPDNIIAQMCDRSEELVSIQI